LEDALTEEVGDGALPRRHGELFVDRDRLAAGDSWEPILRAELRSADIYLFIVSLYTAKGDQSYMWTNEFAVAAQRLEEGTAWIVPVIVEDVATPLNLDKRTRHIAESHCAPTPKRSLKELQEDWYRAVAECVKEACVRFHSQHAAEWDPERQRLTRAKAGERLEAARSVFQTAIFPLGAVTSPECADALECVAAALEVRGPSAPDTIQRVVQRLERLQARLPQHRDDEFDAVAALASRLRVLARGSLDEGLEATDEATKPTFADAKSFGAELPLVIEAVQRARDSAGELRASLAEAPEGVAALLKDAAIESGAHLTIARALAAAPDVDVDAVAAEIEAAKGVAESIGKRSVSLGAAAVEFANKAIHSLIGAVKTASQFVARVLTSRVGGDSASAPDQDGAPEDTYDGVPGELRAVGLQKTVQRRQIVRNLSFLVRRGEIVALLGPEGAGKTETLQMLAGAMRPDTGQVFLDENNISRHTAEARARSGIAHLEWDGRLRNNGRVRQHVEQAARQSARSAGERKEIAEGLLAELRIEHLSSMPLDGLSGGERRRLDVACALATRPTYLLLDEPFRGIDPFAATDLKELFAYLRLRGLGILIAGTNVRDVENFATRALVLCVGEILYEGTPEQVMNSSDVRRMQII